MKIEKLFLVTTALEETWVTDQPVLFLGEWCRLYSRKERWANMRSVVQPYHWNDRERLYLDYQYINELYERVLPDLASVLNVIHGVNHSSRYWRIFVGPWLAYFIHILLDRWMSVHAAVRDYELSGTIILTGADEYLVANDMNTFTTFLGMDEWNHHIYAEILRKVSDAPIQFRDYKIPFNRQIKEGSVIKRRVIGAFKKLIKRYYRDNEVYLNSTYLGALDEWLLSLKFCQIPASWDTVEPISVPINWQKREFEMGCFDANEFESLVSAMLPKQIPRIYLEGYSQLIEQVENLPWPKSPKVIYTSNALWSDTVSMAYAAENIDRGSKLVYGQHGGGYGTAKFHFAEEHEIAISDRYLTWGWSIKSRTSVVPIGIVKVGKRTNRDYVKHRRLLLVTANQHRFSFRLCSESALNILDRFEDSYVFASLLSDSIKNNLLVRLPLWNGSSRLDLRWADRFSGIKLDCGQGNIYSLMRESRIVVQTYNQTGVLESLAMGVPTVLFCDLKITPLRESAVPFYSELKRVGIFHDNPESAAAHVNNVWDSIDDWWGEGSEVQDVLSKFTKQYCYRPDNILGRIESVLREVISEH